MIITNEKISFTKRLKVAVLESDAPKINQTFFRCSERALEDIQKTWIVKFDDELIAVSKEEAQELGYTDCDETLQAVDTRNGFEWVLAND